MTHTKIYIHSMSDGSCQVVFLFFKSEPNFITLILGKTFVFLVISCQYINELQTISQEPLNYLGQKFS